MPPARSLLLAAAALATAVLSPAPGRAQFAANQPFASYWFPNELLVWDPGSDPDAPFNRGSVPLVDRFTNPATQVNAHARDGEAQVVALDVMYPSTSSNPSQGSAQFGVHAFGYWQYLDLLVFWGGSAGEGLILAPSADVIDAGTRTGLPVLGTIFFPPNVYGGQIQWVQDLVQKDGSTFPVADKLIEAATYYGFDGWFLNQETGGGDSTLALAMQEFLVYFQANKPAGMHMMWYDAMVANGAVAWQNELNDQNVMFFEDGGRVSDSIFLNFNWGAGTRLADSRAKAIAVGRSPYEVFAGINVQASGYNVSPNWGKLFPEATVHTTSLGFFGGEWTYTSSSDPADYYARQNRFWVGQNRDPSNTTTALSWKGPAHYVPAKSPVNDVPFVTSFNTGQGNSYAVDGEVLRAEPWNHRSLQDVLPTWRWIAESSNTPLYPELDFSDAWEGGTCLRVSGDLDAGVATDLKLYKTSLLVPSAGAATLAYKTGAVGPSAMKLAISFETDPGAFTYLDVDSTTTAGWNTRTIDLSAWAGQTIAVLGLRFESPSSIPGYEMRVGRLGVIDGTPDVPAAPTTVTIDDILVASNDASASLRMSWSPSVDPVRGYSVYRRNPDSSLSFLGGTPNVVLFVPELLRAGAESTTVLEVEAISPEFGRSLPGTTSVSWAPGPPNEYPEANAGGPYCGPPAVPLAFHSDGTNDPDGAIASYLWTFGDGDSSAAPDPTHAYDSPGAYEVILTVIDDLGKSDADTTSADITTVPPDLVPDVAWYPLDEGAGATAGDSSGNGNDGEIFEAAWTTGIAGGALAFDGADDYVRVPAYTQPASVMTVTGWVRADARAEWGSIVKNWATQTGAFHLGLYGNDGDLQAFLGQSNDGVVELREGAVTPLPTGEWQHVALVADGNEARLYRNGVQVDRAPYDGTLKTSRPGLGIGVKLTNAGTGPNINLPAYWSGALDDVRLYGRALCQTEIESLHAAAATVAPEVGPGSVPASFALGRSFPNPSGGRADLRYSLPHSAHVTLAVYDVAGRRVAQLVDEAQTAGTYRIHWRGRNDAGREVAAGVYFVRMAAEDFRAVRKVLLVR